MEVSITKGEHDLDSLCIKVLKLLADREVRGSSIRLSGLGNWMILLVISALTLGEHLSASCIRHWGRSKVI